MFHVEMCGEVAVLTATKRIEGRHRWTAREQIDDLRPFTAPDFVAALFGQKP